MKPILKQINDHLVEWQEKIFPCRVGRGGFSNNKKEGDGCTPTGSWQLLNVYYRPDKMPKPNTVLPVIEITQNMGWSDDPKDAAYNSCVKLPYAFSHEKLWRDDDLYDLFITIDHNTDPVVPGNGSAIFIHKLRPEGTPTDGCLALNDDDLKYLVETITPDTSWIIGEGLA
ncbi:MAG: L,D-transpeptidase [Pseudomonadota bacterium]|jgi:L,D-peptidoglycan transpeptidase YkuD (ErfK/YbiS/YcfS/YnhG family)|nr:L,D-transpeptidase family protein [Alphaproteobacteria bacterium]